MFMTRDRGVCEWGDCGDGETLRLIELGESTVTGENCCWILDGVEKTKSWKTFDNGVIGVPLPSALSEKLVDIEIELFCCSASVPYRNLVIFAWMLLKTQVITSINFYRPYLSGESTFDTLEPRSKWTRIAILHPVISSRAGEDHSVSASVGVLISKASISSLVAT